MFESNQPTFRFILDDWSFEQLTNFLSSGQVEIHNDSIFCRVNVKKPTTMLLVLSGIYVEGDGSYPGAKLVADVTIEDNEEDDPETLDGSITGTIYDNQSNPIERFKGSLTEFAEWVSS